MPITFSCPCGKSLRVNDEMAGRKARCPGCQAVIDIPSPADEPAFEVVEDDAPPRPLLARPVARPKPPPPPADEPAFDDEDKPLKAKKSDARRVEEDAAEERRKAKRKDRRDREDDDYEDEDEYDRAARRRVTGGGRRRARKGEWHAARIGTLVGSVLCLLLFAGVCYYYAAVSQHRRADSRAIGAGAAAAFSLVGIGRALLGTVAEDE
jgi:hypothetical protein